MSRLYAATRGNWQSGRVPARHSTWPLYVGGFLGPFGGAVVATMLPEMATDLGVSLEAASLSLTAYLVPFAAFMLVSGTLAERFGRRRTVQVAFTTYVVASVACALAPNLSVLLLTRVVQGIANSFTTPVLVAAISSIVPAQRLGRALGLFGSVQALGQAAAPLIGGLAASVHWSWAFWGSAAVAGVLALLPPPDGGGGPAAVPGAQASRNRWRSLANRQLAVACLIAFLAYLTVNGITVVGAIHASSDFGLGPTQRGLAIAGFGVAGILAGRLLGSLLDRYGRLAFGAVVHALLGVGAAAAGLSPWLALMIVFVAIAGAAATGCRAVAQSLAVTATADNRSGATSMMLAWQFGGGAVAPILWVPLYAVAAGTTLVAAALPALAAAALLLGARGISRRGRLDGPSEPTGATPLT